MRCKWELETSFSVGKETEAVFKAANRVEVWCDLDDGSNVKTVCPGIISQSRARHWNYFFFLCNTFLDATSHLQEKQLCLIIIISGSGVTCNAVHPGLVYTDIGRHMSINKSWLAMVMLHPLLWLFLKTPRQGAQTTIYAALSPDLEGVSGKYFRCVLLTDVCVCGVKVRLTKCYSYG